MAEHVSGVYLTKAEAEQKLTELRDHAILASEVAETTDSRDWWLSKASAYRLAMGIVHNINPHCSSCDGYSCDPETGETYRPIPKPENPA